MHTLETDRAGIDSGVFAFTTEFYTEHFVVHAKLSSPERRLSDHLNGSVASVDIRPVSALQLSTGVAAELWQNSRPDYESANPIRRADC